MLFLLAANPVAMDFLGISLRCRVRGPPSEGEGQSSLWGVKESMGRRERGEGKERGKRREDRGERERSRRGGKGKAEKES